MFRFVLFDLDGTLTDPKEGITKSVAYALKAFGIDADCEELTCFIGPPLIDSFKEFYGFDDETALRAVEIYRERFNPIGKFENRVLDGIPNLLEKLSRSGKKLAVASSKPEIFVRQILDRFELAKYFDKIVGSELSGERTNKADVIREAFKRLEISDGDLKNTVMVGDRSFDVMGAHECGIEWIGVEFGYAKEGELRNSGADYICETVEALTTLLCE